MNSVVDLTNAAQWMAPCDDWWMAQPVLDAAHDGLQVTRLKLLGDGTDVTEAADIIVVVQDGCLEIGAGGLALTCRAGETLVLPAGTRFAWRARTPVSMVRLVVRRIPTGSVAPILLVDHAAATKPTGGPAPDLLVGAAPACRSHRQFSANEGRLSVGLWEATPYERTATPYGYYELMHLLEGSVTLTDPAGPAATFHAGQTFLVERAATLAWRSQEAVRKVFAVLRPE